MTSHQSLIKVTADWIDEHQWPKGSDKSESILAISKKDRNGTVFDFQSAFGDLKIKAIHHKVYNSLVDVQIQLVAPGHHKGVTVAKAETYHISSAEGRPISFDIENGYIKGSVSFKYDTRDGRQDIFATYNVHVPYTDDRKGTVDIAPTEVTQATGFTVVQLQEIPQFTPAELKAVEEKAQGYSKTGQTQSVDGEECGKVPPNEHALLVKFLKDFSVDGHSVVIETYYPPPSVGEYAITAGKPPSNQWHATVSFLGVLELVASVDPEKLEISAALQVRIPIIGRVHLFELAGSLLSDKGVVAKLDVLIAKGEATFTAAKNGQGGKHDLYVAAALDIKHLRAIKSNGKERIAALPF